MATEMQDMLLGTMFLGVSRGTIQGEIQLHGAGDEPCIHIKQITTKWYIL
jgi:hypothetical protein